MADAVGASLECALGGYPVFLGDAWSPGWDPEGVLDLADDVPGAPNLWTDGGRDEDPDALIGVAGAGAFVRSVPWVLMVELGGMLKTWMLLKMLLVSFLWSLAGSRLFKGRNIGESFLLCKPSCRCILVLIT